ncbi:MAG: sigma-70 family RNA polymerase sigma factor [Eubacteriales bacterium]|nr:sigma-70 family RNA polymerase sigma factor [Eubacteriales bacterium]
MKTFLKPLSLAEERHYLGLCRQGDLEAKNILIEHNLRLVAHVVKKYQGGGQELDDLISIGTIGLIKAITTFDASKSPRLSTYAARCIDNAILSQMRFWMGARLLFCGCDHPIQQLHLLIRRAVQLPDITIDHVSVDTGSPFCQFTSALLRFWIMDGHLDGNAFSCDTTHLP